MSQGKVILVGAGPGDDGLLTLKGKYWIEQADVIVYDHLVNVRILRFAKKNAKMIFAGKKSGFYTMRQDEINTLMIDKAKAGKTVVRLKGGDPFIFGRGGEEAQALRLADIPFGVVPGVTSPVGVSAYAGIPLTHRDFASTVSIITGTVGKDQSDLMIDWENLAHRPGTLVFLMGARKLRQIASNLMRYGKDPATPIAVIQWGTTPKQKTWTGTLKSISETATKELIQPPALTIVGKVVNLKQTIDWFETQPLFGKRVVVTRPQEQSESFIQLLETKGAFPVAFPVIETVPPLDWAPLDKAIQKLDTYDGLIFTSVNGVRYFINRLIHHDKDIRELKGIRLYAIGPKTSRALQDLGIKVDIIPEEFVAESLLKSMDEESVSGKRFLLPRAAVARETIPDELRLRGAEIDVVSAYQTIPPKTGTDVFFDLLQAGEIDVITFTASSTVKNFMDLLDTKASQALNRVTVACIGPITEQTARDLGLRVDVVASEYTVEGLVNHLEKYFSRQFDR